MANQVEANPRAQSPSKAFAATSEIEVSGKPAVISPAPVNNVDPPQAASLPPSPVPAEQLLPNPVNAVSGAAIISKHQEPETPQAATAVKPARKEQKEKEPQKSNASTTAAISVPVVPLAPQTPEVRPLNFSAPQFKDPVVSAKNAFEGPAAKEYQKRPTATIDTDTDPEKANAGGFRSAGVQSLQSSPLAFSVTLPKSQPAQAGPGERPAHEPAAVVPAGKNAGATEQHSSDTSKQQGQQHTNTRESDQAVSSVKKTASESILKTNATTALTNVVPAPGTGLTVSPHPGQTPYSNQSDLKPLKSEPVAQTERAAEPPSATPASRPQTIDLKISSTENGEVAVRVSQRAGDVQVTVRTADGDLAQSLKQHLPELSDRLVQSGVHGDIWQPSAAQLSSSADPGRDSNPESSKGGDSDSQQQRPDSNHPADDQDQKSRSRPADAWLDELNNA